MLRVGPALVFVLLLALAAAAVAVGGCGDARTGEAGEAGSALDRPDVPDIHPRVDEYSAAAMSVVAPEEARAPVELVVRVARTRQQRRDGLQQVEELPQGTGMLFVYPEARPRTFWMKETIIPLDIAFAGSDGVILATARMQPCDSEPCPTWSSGEPAQYALEVPAGWLDQHGIEAGWRLHWEGGSEHAVAAAAARVRPRHG